MARRKTPGGPPPTRGETSHPHSVRLTPTELADAHALPGADFGAKVRGAIRFTRLVQIGDIAVSPNCDARMIAALTTALSTSGSSDV